MGSSVLKFEKVEELILEVENLNGSSMMELILKRKLAYDYIDFISKSFSEEATRDKLKMAAHYFLCDFGESNLEPRESCGQCKDNNVEIESLNCGMHAEEICEVVLEFINSSSDEATDPYKPILEFCLKIHSDHVQDDIHHSLFEPAEPAEPAYFLTPTEFNNLISYSRPTNFTTMAVVMEEGDSVRIPLRIIDDKYEALDPRLVSKIFDV